ncbi:hypothetical protein PHMEG_00010644 [Phytophthora megakarya]|uniref:Uncharacterized protein n=1 Tax=Phytophthora megakarya TaxID=4795 RepID=A0A225WE71_9STRA|nr:hypothetical protein PHMEG_00010644 [Phytophthora megakarya]
MADAACVSLVQERNVVASAGIGKNMSTKVKSSDGLPTALVMVDGARRHVKINNGTRYTVAGTDWMLRGERVKGVALVDHVDHVEGIGGFLLDELGVWSFDMINVFGQKVTMTAGIVDGCTDEFLVGVDFLESHGASIDFESGKLRYVESKCEVVVPFQASGEHDNKRVAIPIDVAVAVPDGEEGVFAPTTDTVTRVQNGKALVPAVNAHGGPIKLPRKKELGV